MRRPSIARMSATTAFRSSSVGSMICLRLKASSWRVSPAALAPAFWISAMSALARIGRIEVGQQQLAVAENHGQQVVEVVRHAAGQPADGFHLLRLLILRLERAAFGDVGAGAERADRPGRRRPATGCCAIRSAVRRRTW